jgi:hypothetical protein
MEYWIERKIGEMEDVKSERSKVFTQYSNTPILHYSNAFQRIAS